MSHDPYCPLREHEVDHMDDYWCDESCEVDCQCDMIALVREDMRDCDTHGDTIRYRCSHYQQGRKDGYAAGVQAAHDAVAGLPQEVRSFGITSIDRDMALAAIGALRAER